MLREAVLSQNATAVRRDRFEEYKAAKRLNWSKLKHMAKSPAHFQWLASGADLGEKEALVVGRATHCAVLELATFHDRFKVWDGERRAGKKWEEFEGLAKLEGKEVITLDQALQVNNLATAVRKNADAARLIAEGHAETSIYWTANINAAGDFPAHSWPAKSRLDLWAPNAIVDLKTTRDASPSGFAREAWNLGYLGQAAFYVDAAVQASGTHKQFFIIAVEKAPPFAVSVFEVEEHLLDIGREHYKSLLARLARCELTGDWPGYFEGIAPLELPAWVERTDDENPAEMDLEFSSEGDAGGL